MNGGQVTRPVSPPEPFGRRLARWTARRMPTRAIAARPHPPLVSFTFDDIPDSAATCGAAILEEAGARGTFYVAGSLAGSLRGPPAGTPEASAGGPADGAGPDRRFATGARLRDLHRRGHEIGCHTFSHRPVSGLSAAALAQDVARNAECLAALDPGIALTNFAYPFNTTSLGAKRRLGRLFTSCRGGVPGINAGRIDLDFLRAVELADDHSDAAAVRAWIARAVAARGWLVFFSHGVCEAREPWGCAPALLRSAVAEARAQGAAVVTMRAALAQVLGADTPGRAVP